MIFLIFNIILFLILLVLIFIFSMLWPPDSPWAPWWRTDKKTALAICKLAQIKESDIIYDLGCGDGTMIITAVKEKKAKAVGIEIDLSRYLITRFRILKNGLGNKAVAKRSNFFKVDISPASIVVVYLVPKTLENLKQKFLKELKPGTKIVSYKYEMSFKKIKEDKNNNLFLYVI